MILMRTTHSLSDLSFRPYESLESRESLYESPPRESRESLYESRESLGSRRSSRLPQSDLRSSNLGRAS